MTVSGIARSFSLDYGESHLNVSCDLDLRSAALDELIRQYTLLVAYINKNPLFKSSYEPVEVEEDALGVVKDMAEAAFRCGVGPMAAVAGALAQRVGERLLSEGAADVIVDNGGDIYVKAAGVKTVGLNAGKSPFSGEIAFRVKPEETPCGICTSAGTVGHSISLGEADAVTVVADSTALADAAATSIGNEVRGGVEGGLGKAKTIAGIRGVLIVKGGLMGAWGGLPQII